MITEKLAELVQGAGFEVVEDGYVQKETVNVKEGISAPRVFIQGRFLKPPYHVRPPDQIKL